MKVPKSYWSRMVREMDGNKCAFCGTTEHLEAHHIVPQFVSEELAAELENGITLCKKCHYTAHVGKYNEIVELSPSCTRTVWTPQYTTDPRIMRDFITKYQAETEILYCEVPTSLAKAFQALCKIKGTTPNEIFREAAEAFLAENGAEETEKP